MKKAGRGFLSLFWQSAAKRGDNFEKNAKKSKKIKKIQKNY